MYNASNRSVRHPMHPLANSGIPFHTWHLDFIQDLEPSAQGHTNILVAVDRATRYTVAIATKDRSTSTTLSLLHHLSTRFGIPSRIVTDRGLYFMHEFADYCSSQGITLDHSASYHPQTNGLVERVNGVLEGILRKMCDGLWNKWDLFLDSAMFSLNCRVHATTGYSPFYLVHGVSPRLPNDSTPPRLFNFMDADDRDLYTNFELENLGQARAAALRRSNTQARQMAKRHDAQNGVTQVVFEVGQFVKRRKKRLSSQMIPKFAPRWEGPFIIHSVGLHDSYILANPNGDLEPHPVNANHLAPYISKKDLEVATVQQKLVRTIGSNISCILSVKRSWREDTVME
jgi:hypothetical protein